VDVSSLLIWLVAGASALYFVVQLVVWLMGFGDGPKKGKE